MTLAANTIGNLLSRHLRYDLGEASVQNYNASNGRGYLISADGRVAFFVELGGTTPKYAVSFSVGSLTTTERDARTAAAEAFVAGTSWPTSDATSQTNTSSLFYKAYDAAIIELSKSLPRTS